MDWTNAFDQLGEKMMSWVESFILMLPNLAAALLIVVLFWLAARLIRRGIRRGIRRLLGKMSDYAQVSSLLATVGYLAVLATGVFIALGVLELDKTVTSLLAGVGVIGLALAFAFQDIAENFMAGILLTLRRPFRNGDVVATNDHTGLIEEVNLRSTIVRTFQGQIVRIPNSSVFQNPIINYSQLGRRRIDLACGVAYGDDLEKARRVALDAIEGLDLRDESRDVELFYNEFGGSSINFTLRFWIDFRKQTDYLAAQSEAIMRLKKAFDEQDVTIPFPIRTLDFGVVGGEKLSEALPPALFQSRGDSGAASSGSSAARGDAGQAG